LNKTLSFGGVAKCNSNLKLMELFVEGIFKYNFGKGIA